MVSGIPPFYWALEPECRILMFMWSFGPRTGGYHSQGYATQHLRYRVFLKILVRCKGEPLGDRSTPLIPSR